MLLQLSHLWRHKDNIDVFSEVNAIVLEYAQQEAMGQTQSSTGLHCRQDAGVQISLKPGMIVL